MSRYLLDTTALIDFSKGKEPAFSLIHRFIEHGDEVGVSPINVTEFYAGLAPAQREVWDAFFEPLLLWPISLAAAKQAGRFRYDFARRGITLSTTDALVAAVAREVGATLVTSNVKDYPMDEVSLLPLYQERGE
jgi:predicted nucleic acid-binding protein